jgi:hypothetical protein
VKDTNETSEESVPVPMYCEAVKAVETLQQFLQSVSDVPESVMKCVWGNSYIYHRTGSETYETDDLGLIFQETMYRFLKVMTIYIHLCC